MPWIGRFKQDHDRPGENIGIAFADWTETEGGTVMFTYPQRVDGVGNKEEFRTNATAAKTAWELRETKNNTLGTQLTNFLNQ